MYGRECNRRTQAIDGQKAPSVCFAAALTIDGYGAEDAFYCECWVEIA